MEFQDHYRIGRERQVQLTGSSIDSVYVSVHKDSLSILSNNIDLYVLVDKNGDFSESPYQQYKMALSGDFYKVKIPIEDNDYLTFAHVRKIV